MSKIEVFNALQMRFGPSKCTSLKTTLQNANPIWKWRHHLKSSIHCAHYHNRELICEPKTCFIRIMRYNMMEEGENRSQLVWGCVWLWYTECNTVTLKLMCHIDWSGLHELLNINISLVTTHFCCHAYYYEKTNVGRWWIVCIMLHQMFRCNCMGEKPS